MLTSESSDKDILDYNAGGQILRNMTGITFIAWMSNYLNGQPAYKAATVELSGYISNPPLGKIPESEKIAIVRKLLNLGIELK